MSTDMRMATVGAAANTTVHTISTAVGTATAAVTPARSIADRITPTAAVSTRTILHTVPAATLAIAITLEIITATLSMAGSMPNIAPGMVKEAVTTRIIPRDIMLPRTATMLARRIILVTARQANMAIMAIRRIMPGHHTMAAGGPAARDAITLGRHITMVRSSMPAGTTARPRCTPEVSAMAMAPTTSTMPIRDIIVRMAIKKNLDITAATLPVRTMVVNDMPTIEPLSGRFHIAHGL